MHVQVFKGTGRVFGFTARGGAAVLPGQFGPWTPFKQVEIHRDEPHAGVDVNACLDDIDRHGFHLTDAHERITPHGLE